MTQEKLVLINENKKLVVKYSGEEAGKIAYRIFHEGVLVEKMGYRLATECVFKASPSPGIWWSQAYIKTDNGVRRIRSKKIELPSSIQPISPACIDPRFHEITNFSNLDNEISAVLERGFVALGRRDLEAWKLIFPIDWLEDPYGDRNWMFQLHAWRMLDPFLRRFSQDDVDYISRVVNDWVEYELKDRNENSGWLWYDMSTGLRALKISYFLLRCANSKKRHSISKITYVLEQHLNHLTNKKELSSGNHGIFQLNGLMSLIWVLEKLIGWEDLEQLTTAKRYAVEEMTVLLSRQLGMYGVHTEDSPDYHFFAIQKISNVLSAPWWRQIKLKKVRDLLQKAEDAKHWLVTPATECVPVGDSTRALKVKVTEDIYRWPHKVNGEEISARIDGYAVVRSKPECSIDESSFLFFQGSFYSGAHKHSDDLSFVWQERGRYFLIDSGKYGYQSDRFRSYFQSSLAHNTIIVDGKSSSRAKRDAYGSALEGNPFFYDGYWILIGAVNNTHLAFRHRRVVLYKPGSSVVVVDYVQNNKSLNESRKLQLAWHFDPRFTLCLTSDVVSATDDLSGDQVKMKVSSMYGQTGFKISRGRDEDDELFGWVSNDYLKYEPSPSVLINTSLASSNIVLTKFKLGEGPDSDDFEIDENGLRSSNIELLKYISEPGYETGFLSFVADHYGSLSYKKYKDMSHYFKLSEGSRTLFVSFHGSIKPPTLTEDGTKLPVFRLHDLDLTNQPHVLCFSDMLLDLYKDDGVYLGWFLDTKKVKQRDLIEEIINIYVKRYDIDHVLFHGSSGGGHVAVDLAVRMEQIALVSNCQFILDRHFQFEALNKSVEAHDDELVSFDLRSLLKGGSKAKVISYCNKDDYTFPHHKYLEEVLLELLPDGLVVNYFRGDEKAKEKGVRNHNVGFPNGENVRSVLKRYYRDV